jgi:hypothetical protein
MCPGDLCRDGDAGKGFPDYGGVVIDWEREQDELRRRN